MKKGKTSMKNGQLHSIWRSLKRNKLAMASLVFILFLVLIAVFADVIADYETEVITNNIKDRLLAPSAEHWFGTDIFGRDIFARMVHGTRISLKIGLLTMAMSVVGGLVLGAVSGYYGGLIDSIIMRICDVFMSIPAMLLALAIVAATGQGLFNLTLALTVTQIPAFSRIVRSQILSIRDSEFVEAARSVGASDFENITVHIIPNAIGPLIVQATISVATAIIAAAGMSYVGLGIAPPAPEWGMMLSDAREYMRQKPYMLFVPGTAIVLTALSFNLFGDGLRDALDPRLKGSK